MEPKVVPPTIG